ncbi:MAG: N-acetyltransferase, partial [Promethearchaeota archaeon]
IKESYYKNEKEKIILSCFSTNHRAIHLYKKIGFKKIGLRKNQFKINNTYYDEVLMELFIDEYLES